MRSGRAAFVASLLALLAACGGTVSPGGPPPPAAGSGDGSLTLGVAGGAAPGIDRLWVTVHSIALHTDAERAWSAADPSWQRIVLAAPATIDVAAAVNGTIASVVTGRNLPAATYAQARLVLLRADEPLADSARRANLARNAQVDWTGDDGIARSAALEIADNALRIDGPIVVQPGAASDIALHWDVERSLVPLAADRFALRGSLSALDLANSGAIVGLLDKAAFCPPGVRAGCIADAVASAQAPLAGAVAAVVRTAPVTVGERFAVFALYPLPAPPADGFDVVIRGRGMRTMVVRAVPASPADLLAALPTTLGANPADPANPLPIVPVAALDARATLAAAAPPDALLRFFRTLPGGAALEVAVANPDPASRLLARPVVLQPGALRIATYSASAPLVFADSTPAEGADGFGVHANGAATTIVAPAGADVTFALP